jgi:hypothetical protein
MGTYFQAAMGGSVDYEVKLIPNRRADLVIDGKIVVECQVSPISDKDWWQRTADYTAAGYPVIWIWNHARLCHVTQWDAAKGRVVKTGTIAAEGRVPSEMLATQRAGSVVYIAHDNGTVEACQFREIQRPCLSCDGTGHRTSGWDAANGQRWRLRCKYCVRGQVTLQRVAIDRKVMPRYFSGFACTMPLMLYFAAIDLSKASVENYLGVEGIYPDRVQL